MKFLRFGFRNFQGLFFAFTVALCPVVQISADDTARNLTPDHASCLGALATFSLNRTQISPEAIEANRKALVQIILADERLKKEDRDSMVSFLNALNDDSSSFVELRVGLSSVRNEVDFWAHWSDLIKITALSHSEEFLDTAYLGNEVSAFAKQKHTALRLGKMLRRSTIAISVLALGFFAVVKPEFKDLNLDPVKAHLFTQLFIKSFLGILIFSLFCDGIQIFSESQNQAKAHKLITQIMPTEQVHGTARNYLLTLPRIFIDSPRYFFWNSNITPALISFLKEKLKLDLRSLSSESLRRQLLFFSTDKNGEPILFYAAGKI